MNTGTKGIYRIFYNYQHDTQKKMSLYGQVPSKHTENAKNVECTWKSLYILCN